MNEEYDAIILGTGLKECILSGLLSVNKYKVLHMDRNDYYGAESASLNLQQLYKKFKPEKEPDQEKMGRARDYNVDQCPKFIMANGDLVKMLLKTQVTRYLEFKSVDGSYVAKGGKMHAVPMTPAAALKSGLMGMMQKRRYKNFLEWVMGVLPNDRDSWNYKGGTFSKGAVLDLTKLTMKEVYEYWKIADDTRMFTGHAVALYTNDSYMSDPAQTLPTIMRMQLYATSLARYGTSPYIYPCWGLGGLPEGFSRLAAVHGGVYMLRRPIAKILFNDDGTAKGVVSPDPEDETGEKTEEAFCKQLIADPSYFAGTDKVKKVGQVAQWLVILTAPPPGISGDSAQIIIPGSQLGRANDIYVSLQGWGLQCAPQGRFIAMVSSNVETADPRRELEPALQMLGSVVEEFFFVRDIYEPTNQGVNDNCFISSSMDATTNFQSVTQEVMALYKQITGKDVDLTADTATLNQDS